VSLIVGFLQKHKSILLFICLLASFRGAVADWHPVPTGSMKPTILEGDVIWHNKLAYDLKFPFTNVQLLNLGDPKRGDIVVVNSDKADMRLVKRLIGLPGDVIRIENNQLSVNGIAAQYQTLTEDDLSSLRTVDRESGRYRFEMLDGLPTHVVHHRSVNASYKPMFIPTVPEGHYFMMGDSRNNSVDSRYYGSFPRQEIRSSCASAHNVNWNTCYM